MTDLDEEIRGSQAPAAMSVSPARMPLGARRLVLIGSLCVLAGILAGRYFLGGLVLASAGITVLALALSYRVGKAWFSPWSWLVGAGGALWTAATGGYWWLINAAADASSGPPENASLLFYVGIGALVVMIGGVLAAGILRMSRGRRTGRP